MKRLMAKLLVSVLAIGAVTLAVSDARADAKIHGVNFMMKALLDETFCVTAATETTTEGRSVFLSKCTGAENQRWTYTDGADGTSVVVGHLGMCLDIRNRKTGDNTPIGIWKCHYGNNQRFRVTPSGHIKEVQSGKCITVAKTAVEHGAVYIDECDEQVKQQTWRLVQ